MNNKNFSYLFFRILTIVLIVGMGYFALTKKIANNNEMTGWRTYQFSNFHGAKVTSDSFEFKYPANWYNDSQYFSPNKIKYYDITSVDAPIYFDLIAESLFDTSDLKYQIDHDKRNEPDVFAKIAGRDFKKYNLIDYGGYVGENSDKVLIYLGPKIHVNNEVYYIVFRWEERPLTIPIPNNDPKIFEEMLSTLKFKN